MFLPALRDLRHVVAFAMVCTSTLLPFGLAAQAGVPRTSTPSPDAEIYLSSLVMRAGYPVPGEPKNLTRRIGYDNQPSFSADSRSLFFTSNRGDGQTDIYRHDFASGNTVAARSTRPESEYSATASADGKSMTVIRVEADSTQRLWRLSLDGGADAPIFTDIKPVGYYAQANDSTWAMFVLGSPVTMHVATTTGTGSRIVARNIGRSLHRIPGTNKVSFVQKGGDTWWIMSFDPATNQVDTLIATRPRSEDITWADGSTLLTGQGTKLYAWKRGDVDWREIADFASASLGNISRLVVSPDGKMLAFVAESKEGINQ